MEYTKKYTNELNEKPFDRMILSDFCSKNSSKGLMVDLGCGPGQTTSYLAVAGAHIIGIDISEELIVQAQKNNPNVKYEVGDMLSLNYPVSSFASGLVFYSIVHFSISQVKQALAEIYRILKTEGQFLFTFHIGYQSIHLDNFLGHNVNIDFHFFEVAKIKELLIEANFEIIDCIQRSPYKDEYQSERAYVWVEKKITNHC